MFTEKTDLVFWGRLLVFDAVSTMPAFVHDEADLGGETAWGGVLQFIDLRREIIIIIS